MTNLYGPVKHIVYIDDIPEIIGQQLGQI